MKLLTSFLLCLLPVFSFSQLTDDFTDGDFTNNPLWTGDASEFTVNGSQQLQLNSSGAGSSYLSVATNLSNLDNTEWRFFIHLNFAPSSSNYGRVYLVSDQTNLENPLNGYYLQFGETGTNDAVELFKQSGSTSTSVARGTNGQIAATFSIGVKVTRDASANWNLYVDPAGAQNYSLQATGTDNTYSTSSFFGVLCVYTTTNATNFFFDDFSLPFQVDVTPPSISSLNVNSNTQLDVLFSEPVNPVTAQAISNYLADNGIGNPSSAIIDGVNPALVHLTFGTVFQNGITNTLTVVNVSDLNNNSITTATSNFTWLAPVTADLQDVVINEIMADPDPPIGLPNAEYVEIYNRSNKTFNLNGWKFSDSGSPVNLSSATLAPGDYLILCDVADTGLFSSFGNVLGVSSFPALNNTGGDDVVIYDNTSAIIDKIHYDETWYNDASKASGGWSIERIDPDFPCAVPTDWKASADAKGGTPGKINSVKNTFTDNESPKLVRAYIVSVNQVKLFFNEAMDAGTLADTNNYLIDNSIGKPNAVAPSTDNLSAVLTLNSNLQQHIFYTVTLSASIKDCSGNAISSVKTTEFRFADTVAVSDVLINEILFNPRTDGTDYVEIYNRSEKVIDLKDLRIANATSQYSLSAEGYLFFPGDYLVVTQNPEAVKQQYFVANPDGFVKLSGMPSYNDDEGEVILKDNSGNVIDDFKYSEKFQFPLLNDPEGVSLERLSANRPTQDSTNWHSAAEAVGFGTPTYKNSQYNDETSDGNNFSVTPEVFSPDNDGYEDVVNILYHFDSPAYTANVTVFDAKGRTTRNLVKNKLLGNDGTFSWDGITNGNEKARVGIYVFYIEVFSENGDVKKYKKTCVLASKL